MMGSRNKRKINQNIKKQGNTKKETLVMKPERRKPFRVLNPLHLERLKEGLIPVPGMYEN
jgi:hypothetical protein